MTDGVRLSNEDVARARARKAVVDEVARYFGTDAPAAMRRVSILVRARGPEVEPNDKGGVASTRRT